MSVLFNVILTTLLVLWSFVWRSFAFGILACVVVRVIGSEMPIIRRQMHEQASILAMFAASLIASFAVNVGWIPAVVSALILMPISYAVIRSILQHGGAMASSQEQE